MESDPDTGEDGGEDENEAPRTKSGAQKTKKQPNRSLGMRSMLRLSKM
jgi:hypothetical protein